MEKIGQNILGLMLGMTLASASASAAMSGNFEKPTADQPSATAYGKTLPPFGYVDFCGRDEPECKFAGGKQEVLALTDSALAKLRQVNHYVNSTIRPVTDWENYGVPDYWTYPVSTGDCEDYVLLKKRELAGLGVNADELLITVVLDEHGDGHAVLMVPTDKGDFVLDNRRQEILRWDETGYTYLKRQSQEQANQWVSLQRAPSGTGVIAVGTQRN